MNTGRLVISSLVVQVLLSRPSGLAAQSPGSPFVGLAVGTVFKPAYGLSRRTGTMVRAEWGSVVRPRVSARVEVELQGYASEPPPVVAWAPCRPGTVCPMESVTYTGNGRIQLAAARASVELFEQPNWRGFFVIGGVGPQIILAHPDRSPAIRLVAQGGAGLALGSVLVEARYQATAGARAVPRHVVALSLGLRRYWRAGA